MSPRFLGAALLLAACAAAGMLLSRELFGRVTLLRALADAAEEMRAEIRSLGSPAPELLRRVAHGAAAPFFHRVGALLAASPEEGLSEAFRRAAEELPLSPAEREAASSLGSGFGRLAQEEQLSRLSAAEIALSRCADAAAERAARHAPLCRFGGFATGILVLLALI